MRRLQPALRRRIKKIVLFAWVTVACVLGVGWLASGISFWEGLALLDATLRQMSPLELALFYTAFFIVRPFVILPGTLITIVTGRILWVPLGVLVSSVGGTVSAVIAFSVARSAGREFVEERETAAVRKFERHLKRNGFLTVLLMRVLYIPYDAVNVAAGLSSMRMRDFVLASFIGQLPGTLGFILLGRTAMW